MRSKEQQRIEPQEIKSALLVADYTVVGGGISGYATAIELAKQSKSVVLIEPRKKPDDRSLFVRGDVLVLARNYPADIETSINSWQYEADASKTHIKFDLPNPESVDEGYFMVGHDTIITALKTNFESLGGKIICEGAKGRVKTVLDLPDQVVLRLTDGTLLKTGRIVDATGKDSVVLRNTHDSSEQQIFNEGDPIVMWVFGKCYSSGWPDSLERTIFTPVSTNAGRVSWAAPYGDGRFDIVASDYCRLSDLRKPSHIKTMKKMFANLLDMCKKYDIYPQDTGKAIFGAVRVIPMKSNQSNNVFAVGEAAGYPSPFMAESITPALMHAQPTATMMTSNQSPEQHLNYWKKQKPLFPYTLETALLQRRLTNTEAGRNAPFYAKATARLNEKEQRMLLHNRRLDAQTLLRRAPQLLLDKSFLFWTMRTGVTFLELLANGGQLSESQKEKQLFPGINYEIE
ncbi:MAG: hypothetical protein BroJett025_09310 [Patescibacteria group bacterium]|nr:MAG: hypothetical protein BroJett025_09310 [Patescibacteria group bacterium]